MGLTTMQRYCAACNKVATMRQTPVTLSLIIVDATLRLEVCVAILVLVSWLRGPVVEHWSLADVLSLSCARLVADG